MTYLLDVNLLLALVDPAHIHHRMAHDWFERVPDREWATCPITENGFIRVGSHPKYPNRLGDAPVLLGVLRDMCGSPAHRFWSESVSLRVTLAPDQAFTHNAITDIYLLALAIAHGGKLATFDKKIPSGVYPQGPQSLELL